MHRFDGHPVLYVRPSTFTSMTSDLAVRNCTVVTPAGQAPYAGVAVEDRTFAAIGGTDRTDRPNKSVDIGDRDVDSTRDVSHHGVRPELATRVTDTTRGPL
nr:hypothetical protein [Halosimplex salinum]